MANYISRIFGESPVSPMQDHMETCFKAARALLPFFDKAISEQWDEVALVRDQIVALENEADDLKKNIRGQLPKSMFMPVPREDLLNLLWAQDQIANTARDISGLVLGREMKIPKEIREDFSIYIERNVDAAKKARKSIRELDELYTTGFRGAEAAFVEKLVHELDEIENETDEMQAKVRAGLFKIEQDLPAVDVIFLYKIIELIGQIGDMSERIGRRLELLLSH
ncbi:MAG: TIGR00153 family protein [Gammaproteobacteria bacterium]|nr:TIGR00153 family protein [Gammaproteobacteria bacterium]